MMIKFSLLLITYIYLASISAKLVQSKPKNVLILVGKLPESVYDLFSYIIKTDDD